MERTQGVLTFLVKDFHPNKTYTDNFKSAGNLAKNENFFYSRWQTTIIAIETYVQRIFITISCLGAMLLLKPVIELLKGNFLQSWPLLSRGALITACNVKLLVVLPFIFIGGFFAPQKVYGEINKSLNES